LSGRMEQLRLEDRIIYCGPGIKADEVIGVIKPLLDHQRITTAPSSESLDGEFLTGVYREKPLNRKWNKMGVLYVGYARDTELPAGEQSAGSINISPYGDKHIIDLIDVPEDYRCVHVDFVLKYASFRYKNYLVNIHKTRNYLW